MTAWTGFCADRECPCFAPDRFVCDEFKGDGDNYRCWECGWPEAIHDMRDAMTEAGLRLTIGTERINPTTEEASA